MSALSTSSPPTPNPAERRSARLLKGPVIATILGLTAPNLVVMLAQAAANFLESYYVGLIGVDALAGAALVFPLVMLMQMMSAGGIGGGISSAIARALGAGRHEEAEAIAMHAIILGAAIGLIFSAATLFFGPLLYQAMGGKAGSLEAALGYSNAIFSGAIFLWLLNAQASILRGTGNMVLPALVLTCGVPVLLIASPCLIFGFGPVPAFGVSGAGLALVLYYVLGFVILTINLRGGKSGLKLRFHHALRTKTFSDILRVGIPGVLNNLSLNLAVVIATSLIAPLGAGALAGFGLGIRLEYLQIPIVFGIGSGLVAMIGMNIGAKQFSRARRIALTGACIAGLATGTLGCAAAVFPRIWLSLFTQDQAAIETGAQYLHIAAPAYGIFGFGQALSFASQGAKRMSFSVYAGFARVLIVAFGGSAVLLWGGGEIAAGFTSFTLFLIVLVSAIVVFAAINLIPWLQSPMAKTH